jgi:hypothetical protein
VGTTGGFRLATGLPGSLVALWFTGPCRRGFPDVPDGHRGDQLPHGVVGRKHPVVAMPVFSRGWHERCEPVEELVRRERDDALRVGRG